MNHHIKTDRRQLLAAGASALGLAGVGLVVGGAVLAWP